jgi:hypothetical protein
MMLAERIRQDPDIRNRGSETLHRSMTVRELSLGPNGKPLLRIEVADAIAWLKIRRYNPDRVAILESVLHRAV